MRSLKICSVIACIAVLVFLNGCAAGVHYLGSIELKDGSMVEYINIGSKGQDAPKLTVIEGYRYLPESNMSVKEGAYQGAGPSLTTSILGGSGPAAIMGITAVGAAAILRPPQTTITTSANANPQQSQTAAPVAHSIASPTVNSSSTSQSDPVMNQTATSSSTSNPVVSPTVTSSSTSNPVVSPTVTSSSTSNPVVSPTISPSITVSPTVSPTIAPVTTTTVAPVTTTTVAPVTTTTVAPVTTTTVAPVTTTTVAPVTTTTVTPSGGGPTCVGANACSDSD